MFPTRFVAVARHLAAVALFDGADVSGCVPDGDPDEHVTLPNDADDTGNFVHFQPCIP